MILSQLFKQEMFHLKMDIFSDSLESTTVDAFLVCDLKSGVIPLKIWVRTRGLDIGNNLI